MGGGGYGGVVGEGGGGLSVVTPTYFCFGWGRVEGCLSYRQASEGIYLTIVVVVVIVVLVEVDVWVGAPMVVLVVRRGRRL